MKKFYLLIIIVVLLFALTACAGTSRDIMSVINEVVYHPQLPEERTSLRLGVVAGPYGDMLMDSIQPVLAAQGYTIELVMFDDFVQPNMALANHEIDLNAYQHSMFLNNFKFEHDVELSPIVEIPTVSMGVFSTRFNYMEDIDDGSLVAIPSDATNLARALRVLDAAGLITLDPMSDANVATEADIVRNPRELAFNLVEAPDLVDSLATHDLAVITGAFAYAAGLDIADALYNEVLQDGLMIVIAVRTEDLARLFVQDILDAIHSDEFREFIIAEDSRYNGFQRPRYFFQ